MKLTVTKLYILYFILFFSFSCEQNSDNIISEGIDEWKNKEFILERYYTLVDTFATVTYYLPVIVRHSENSQVKVMWYVNNTPVTHIEIEKEQIAESDMWQSIYRPTWKDYELKMDDIVKAEVILNHQKTEQTAVIHENKIVRDVLGVKFGMSLQEVKEAETNRVQMDNQETDGALWKEMDAYSLLWYSSNFSQGITLYYFSDGKLIEAGEFTYIIENVSGEKTINQKVIDLCYKYGLEKTIQLDENKIPIEDYVWNNGQLQFRLQYLPEIPISKNGDDTCAGLGIIYAKL